MHLNNCRIASICPSSIASSQQVVELLQVVEPSQELDEQLMLLKMQMLTLLAKLTMLQLMEKTTRNFPEGVPKLDSDEKVSRCQTRETRAVPPHSVL